MNLPFFNYLKTHSSPLPTFLEELKANIPDSERHLICDEEVSNFFIVLLKLHRPKSILEIGTHIGYTTLLFDYYSKGLAKVVSIEKHNKKFEQASRNIKKFGVYQQIELIHGDAFDLLDEMNQTFDLIFIDASKRKTIALYHKCLKQLSHNGVIIVDNALYHNMVLDKHTKNPFALAMKAFNKHLVDDKQVDNILLPIGDGLQVIWKNNMTS